MFGLGPYHRMCAAGFVLALTVMTGLTITPFFVFNQLEGGADMSGFIGGAQAAAYALSCLVSSRFALRAQNGLRWATFGAAGFAACYCLMPLSRSPVLCGAAVTAAMGALAFAWPAMHSWVGAEPDPSVRARHMSWFNIAWSSGFAVGPLLAGPLYDLDYRLPFLGLFAGSAAAVSLLCSLPHEKDYFGAVNAEVLDSRHEHDRASEAFLYAAWFATVMSHALVAITRSVYTKRVDELVESGQLRLLFEETAPEYLMSAAATKYSWLACILALSTAVCFPILGRTSFWRHKFGVILLSQIAAGLSFWLLSYTHSLVVMLLCFAAVGANHGVCFFSSVYYSLSNAELKHRRAAVNEAAVGLGAFGGSIAYGYAAGRYGLTVPFRWTPLLTTLGLFICFALLAYGKRKNR